MAVDTQDMTSLYLHNVLHEGGRPFSYRSRIRLLLGLPADEGIKVSFAQPLPGASFVYVHPRFTGEYSGPDEMFSGSPRQVTTRVDEFVDLSFISSKSAPEGEGKSRPASLTVGQRADRAPGHASIARPNMSVTLEPVPKSAAQDVSLAEETNRPTAKRQEQTLAQTDVPDAIIRPSQAASVPTGGVRLEPIRKPVGGASNYTEPPTEPQRFTDRYLEEGSLMIPGFTEHTRAELPDSNEQAVSSDSLPSPEAANVGGQLEEQLQGAKGNAPTVVPYQPVVSHTSQAPRMLADRAMEESPTVRRHWQKMSLPRPASLNTEQPTTVQLPYATDTSSRAVREPARTVATQAEPTQLATASAAKEKYLPKMTGEQSQVVKTYESDSSAQRLPPRSSSAAATDWPLEIAPSVQTNAPSFALHQPMTGSHSSQASRSPANEAGAGSITGAVTMVEMSLPSSEPLNVNRPTSARLSDAAIASRGMQTPAPVDKRAAAGSNRSEPMRSTARGHPAETASNPVDTTTGVRITGEPSMAAVDLPIQEPTRLAHIRPIASHVVQARVSPKIRAMPVIGQGELIQPEEGAGQTAREVMGTTETTQPSKLANQVLTMKNRGDSSRSSSPLSAGHTQTKDAVASDRPTVAPPAPQVIVVRQPARKAALPAAFWERRHLSRLRTRILR